MAADIAMAQFGFAIMDLVVSGLLLADDLVLISRTEEGLRCLLRTVKFHTDSLKMLISESKSEIICPGDEEWNLTNSQGEVELSLKSVLQYKYLGILMHGSMHKTGKAKQEQALKTARQYKGACLKMSKMGPDTVDLAKTCWTSVALPSIIFGCNVVPFTETKIVEIERIQSQLAKSLLGLPLGAANLCAQETMGWKTFRHLLYQSVLSFYLRLLHLPVERWSHKALMEHLEGGWSSPYLGYVHKIRSEVGLLDLPTSPATLTLLLDYFFLDKTNKMILDLGLPALVQKVDFKTRPFVTELQESLEIARFRYDSVNLGNHAPRPGFERKKFCVLCPSPVIVSGVHLVRCPYLIDIQSSTGISSFFNICLLKGLDMNTTFAFYVNGLDSSGNYVGEEDYKSRGKALLKLTKMYLNRWK